MNRKTIFVSAIAAAVIIFLSAYILLSPSKGQNIGDQDKTEIRYYRDILKDAIYQGDSVIIKLKYNKSNEKLQFIFEVRPDSIFSTAVNQNYNQLYKENVALFALQFKDTESFTISEVDIMARNTSQRLDSNDNPRIFISEGSLTMSTDEFLSLDTVETRYYYHNYHMRHLN